MIDPYEYEERAAIKQFDGGTTRSQAEREARQELQAKRDREKELGIDVSETKRP